MDQKTIKRSLLACTLPAIALASVCLALLTTAAAQQAETKPASSGSPFEATSEINKVVTLEQVAKRHPLSPGPVTTAKEYLRRFNENPLAIIFADLPPEQVAIVAKELRERFPFESLAERLAYEREQFGETKPAPRKKKEEQLRRFFNAREKSLERIHTEEVADFINRSGFGISRMPEPTPNRLFVPDQPIPLATVPISEELGNELAVSIPAKHDNDGSRADVAFMPSAASLDRHALLNAYNFASPDGLGYVKDREHVAGFVAHRIPYAFPLVNPVRQRQALPLRKSQSAKSKKAGHSENVPSAPNWETANLELVSLLKHDEPAVYVSDNLPAMSELLKAELRPLNEFESNALSELKEGEQVVHRATLNRIQMVGAIRASANCTECHYAPEGTLLGAFTYEFVRVPHIKAAGADDSARLKPVF